MGDNSGYLDNLNKPVTPSNQPIYKVQRVAGVEMFHCKIYFKTYWICFVTKEMYIFIASLF